MSIDDECKSVKYGDNSKLTNWILDSGATCHMTPEVTDFIPGSLEDTDKFIEVADGHHVRRIGSHVYFVQYVLMLPHFLLC